MDSEITIVRRVRRPKESPPFYKMETDETVKEWAITNTHINSSTGLTNTIRISPYTDLIPIHYLSYRDIHNDRNNTDENYINRNAIEGLQIQGYYGDNPIECFSICNGYIMPTGQNPYKWRGFLTMFEEYKPVVIPVILPENLVYQKLYILKHGKIDLTKVIVLIDRELDSTSYPNKRTREIYRKELLPLIQSTACQVWKVPQSFISENCFMQDFKLRAAGIRERKQEKQDIMNKFRESISEGMERAPITLDLGVGSVTVSEGLAGRLTSTGGATGIRIDTEGRIMPTVEENLPW